MYYLCAINFRIFIKPHSYIPFVCGSIWSTHVLLCDLFDSITMTNVEAIKASKIEATNRNFSTLLRDPQLIAACNNNYGLVLNFTCV